MLDKVEKAEEEGIKIGMDKGIEQGLEQTTRNMLKENIGIEIISKVTGLNIAQINELENKNFCSCFFVD